MLDHARLMVLMVDVMMLKFVPTCFWKATQGIDYVNGRGEAQHSKSFWLLQVVAFCYPFLI